MTNVRTLPFILNDANFLLHMREILQARSMFLTDHAKKRMVQRKVSSQQILQCLQRGSIDEPAHLTIQGDWSATIGYFTGGDYVKVAAAISKDNKGEIIIVITVIV
jgi:hypothetical protein